MALFDKRVSSCTDHHIMLTYMSLTLIRHLLSNLPHITVLTTKVWNIHVMSRMKPLLQPWLLMDTLATGGQWLSMWASSLGLITIISSRSTSCWLMLTVYMHYSTDLVFICSVLCDYCLWVNCCWHQKHQYKRKRCTYKKAFQCRKVCTLIIRCCFNTYSKSSSSQ